MSPMVEFFRKLFDSDFMPHGTCYLWQPGVLWVNVISDSLIALAYVVISLQLLYFFRHRRDMPFSWILVMFGLFIFGCGATHAMGMWTVWHGTYRLSGLIKAITALASVSTAVMMAPLVPKALALPSPGELRQANRELEGLAYTVAHDLRAPIRAIRGFSSTISEDCGATLAPQAKDYLSRVVQSAIQMDELVLDLLKYSTLGRTAVNIRPTDLGGAIGEALEQIKPEIQSSSGNVAVEGPIPAVMGDRSIVVQIVSNLVSNGLKFAALGTRPQVRVRAESNDGWVRLWVEDEGIGIAPEHIGRVFDPFVRLHRNEVYEGTGIGLAIVQRGAERLGGRVGVESVPGRGSRFWVDFQRAGG
jgi:signal transduction histidine kinase